jgi:magnesium-transporting ATPase (P-type)
VRDGERQVIDAAELVPGDVALVEEGERIAADMRLISGAVEVDLSTITGESVPAMRSAEYHDRDRPRLQSRELLFAGSMCTGGDAEAVVFATGMHTELGRIAALSQGVNEEPSPLDQQVRRVSWLIAKVAVALAIAFVPLAIFVTTDTVGEGRVWDAVRYWRLWATDVGCERCRPSGTAWPHQ